MSSARTEIRNKGRNVAGSKGQVRDAMLTRFSTVSADATVNDVLDQLRDGCSWALPVVDHGRFLGIVDRDRFLEAIAASDWQRRAREFVQQKYPVLRETDPLEESWRRMQGDEFYLGPCRAGRPACGHCHSGQREELGNFSRRSCQEILRKHHSRIATPRSAPIRGVWPSCSAGCSPPRYSPGYGRAGVFRMVPSGSACHTRPKVTSKAVSQLPQ